MLAPSIVKLQALRNENATYKGSLGTDIHVHHVGVLFKGLVWMELASFALVSFSLLSQYSFLTLKQVIAKIII